MKFFISSKWFKNPKDLIYTKTAVVLKFCVEFRLFPRVSKIGHTKMDFTQICRLIRLKFDLGPIKPYDSHQSLAAPAKFFAK